MNKLNWRGNKVFEQLSKSSQEFLTEVAQEIVDDAKTNHEYQNVTGTNTASISWDPEKNGVKIYTTSGYGGYLEIGTSKMQPYPAIIPAFERAKKTFGKDLEKYIKNKGNK